MALLHVACKSRAVIYMPLLINLFNFNSLYTIKKTIVIFSFPGMITSVFMSLLLDISDLKRVSM